MVKVKFDPEGITIQEYINQEDLSAITFIPSSKFESYNCKEPVVVTVPEDIKKVGSKFIKMEVTVVDSWRVKATFKSNNDVSYEILSHMRHKILPILCADSRISFERYVTAKRCFGSMDVEVSVVNGSASFKGGRTSCFIIREEGEPYCMIPGNCLKLLNKFLGVTIKSSKLEFCKKEDKFLFLVEKDNYKIDIQLW